MKQYKHYSFDLWGTLIKPNPAFQKARVEYLHYLYLHLDTSHYSKDAIEHEVVNVSRKFNKINEITGVHTPCETMYLMHLQNVVSSKKYINDVTLKDLENIQTQINILFFENPPELYEGKKTKEILEQLRNTGASLSILSNTGYIQGAHLKKVLRTLEIAHIFDFMLFSDVTGLSKPNPLAFHHILEALSTLREGDCETNDIIHVGDSETADIAGANAIGIDSLLVNSNGVSIQTLL